jgi:hypothetical protein
VAIESSKVVVASHDITDDSVLRGAGGVNGVQGSSIYMNPGGTGLGINVSPTTTGLDVDGNMKLRSGNEFRCEGQLLTGVDGASATAIDNNGSIPITSTTVEVEANDSNPKTGVRFAENGSAGQLLIVQNTGDQTLRFDASVSRIRGLNTSHDTLNPGSTTLFVSDGSNWNVVGGGTDTVATQNGLSPPPE